MARGGPFPNIKVGHSGLTKTKGLLFLPSRALKKASKVSGKDKVVASFVMLICSRDIWTGDAANVRLWPSPVNERNW